MKRSDLEHILRASKGITGETEFIVIGSQAILGTFPDAPRALRESMETDLYPKHRPELTAIPRRSRRSEHLYSFNGARTFLSAAA